MEILRKTGLISLHKELIHLYYQNLYRRPKLRTFFMGVASLYLLKRLSQLVGMLIPSFRRNLSNRYGHGSWAVVTGASDGIGKEFCFELAKLGFNIALVARNEKKMDDICIQLQALGVQTKIIVVDFSQGCTVEFYQKIQAELQYLDVSILVNNVGQGGASEFSKQKMEDIFSILRVNSISNLMMTKMLITKLEQRNKRSAVISISSGLAQLPCPLVCAYSATKAFNHYFTQSLGYTSKNTDFLSVTPLGVSTKMMAYKKGGNVIEPNYLVKNVLNDLREGKRTSCGSAQHRRVINYLLWRKPAVSEQARIQIGSRLKEVYEQQPQ